MYKILQKLFTLIVCACLSLLVTGQTLIIDENVVFKKGIYKTFDDFKFNEPSFPLNYKIDTVRYQINDQSITKKEHLSYRLAVSKDESKAIGEIFGFCDGKKIYINESFPVLTDKKDFDELLFVGLYSYFEQYMYMPSELGAQSYGSIVKKAININRGETFDLEKVSYQTIFNNDSIVISQFEKDNKKKENLRDFIALYSLKHKIDGIDCRDHKMTRQEADSFIVRTKDDYNDSIYYNRVFAKLKTNPAFSEATLHKQYYSNGKLKTIGFTSRCNFDINDNFMYSIGVWKVFYRTGQLKEIIEYTTKSAVLSRKQFDKSGRLITK